MKFAAFFVAAALVAAESHAAPAPRCAARRDLVGPCFMLHGVLKAWNGAPTLRISRVGTKRILGVTGTEDGSDLPQNLRGRAGFAVEISGDYRVCPLSRRRPGWMQFVCIADARRLVFRSTEHDR